MSRISINVEDSGKYRFHELLLVEPERNSSKLTHTPLPCEGTKLPEATTKEESERSLPVRGAKNVRHGSCAESPAGGGGDGERGENASLKTKEHKP